MYLAARAARNSKYLSCNWISQRPTTLVSFIKFSKHSAIIEVKVYKYAGTWTIKAISWWCWADRELPPTDSKTWPPPPSHTKFHAARYPIRGKGHRIPQRLECNLRFSCFDDCTDTILPTLNPMKMSAKKRKFCVHEWGKSKGVVICIGVAVAHMTRPGGLVQPPGNECTCGNWHCVHTAGSGAAMP